MKLKLFFSFCLFLIICFNSFSQKDSMALQKYKLSISTDTLIFKTVTDTPTKDFLHDPNFPILLSSLITVISLLITFFNIKKQMKNSKELVELQHQRTISSKNIQDWITILRATVTKITNSAFLLNQELQQPKPDATKVSTLYEKITTSYFKLNVYVTDKEKDGKVHVDGNTLLTALSNLKDYIDTKYIQYQQGAFKPDNLLNEKIQSVLIAGRYQSYNVWQKYVKEPWDLNKKR